jgi:hypothetical protein
MQEVIFCKLLQSQEKDVIPIGAKRRISGVLFI